MSMPPVRWSSPYLSLGELVYSSTIGAIWWLEKKEGEMLPESHTAVLLGPRPSPSHTEPKVETPRLLQIMPFPTSVPFFLICWNRFSIKFTFIAEIPSIFRAVVNVLTEFKKPGLRPKL
jgi:hypothetical protein